MRATASLRSLTRAAAHSTRPVALRTLPALTSCSSFAIPSPSSPSQALPQARRTFHASLLRASDAPTYTIGDLTDRQYHDLADRVMDRLTEYLEETIDELDLDGTDVEYSRSMCGKSGVLTVKLGDKGTYVINKQPPNKQIWLSSPVSGPKRYDYSPAHKVWFYARDNDLLHDLLNRELRELLEDERIEVDLGEGEE
ncbi:hypothetical protein JCM8097_007753 [Rhodosporidiobolus ruineniae]